MRQRNEISPATGFALAAFMGCGGAAALQVADRAAELEPKRNRPRLQAHADDRIEMIRAEYQRVQDVLSQLNRRTIAYEDVPFGGELDLWFEGGQIVKAVDQPLSEHGESITEYYFRNGECIFVFSSTRFFPVDESVPGQLTEQRYYLVDGELLRHLRRGASVPAETEPDLREVPHSRQPVTGRTGEETLAWIRESVAWVLESAALPE